MKRLAYLPDFGLGLVYLVAWAAPHVVGQTLVSWLILGIELELVALLGAYIISIAHLAAMDRRKDWKLRVLGPAILATLVVFVVLQIQRYQFWWPAVALAGLIGNRLAGALSGALASEDARLALFADALMGIGIYVLAVGPTFYFPVPTPGVDLGPLSPEHARWCALPADWVADFFDQPVAATWCSEPHRALAGGALYFLVSAFRGARRSQSAVRAPA